MPPPNFSRFVLYCWLAVSLAVRSAAALDAEALFAQVRDRIVQVRLIDSASVAKTSIGSGFYVSRTGIVLTNYHVVAKSVAEPARHRIELVSAGKVTAPATVLAVDVVNDLALLQTDHVVAEPFEFLATAPEQGTRIYSLGNPLDLGSSIVEGIYNGIAKGSLYGRVHLTAPINPGMSGGPALNADGRVVGVNVASAGNEVGFLVPGERAHALVERFLGAAPVASADLWEDVRQQLIANQAGLVDRLLAQPFASVALGPFVLPIDDSETLNCWGTTSHGEHQPYEVVEHRCSTREDVFVGEGIDAGSISLRHAWVRSDELSSVRFLRLFESKFRQIGAPSEMFSFLLDTADEKVSPFECTTDFVDVRGATWKAVACLRSHRKLKGLYDVEVSVASIDASRQGAVSNLTATGLSPANADALARRYLEAIQRKP